MKCAMIRDLRVHVAGQGFEVRRIVQPAVEMRADKVYLLTDPPTGRVAKYHKAVLEALRAARVETVVVTAPVWDPNAVVGEIGRIAAAERGNHLYVNLGTGPKTCAIAATLAAMLWTLEAYYPRVDYTATDLPLPDDYPVKEVTFVPTFHLDPPGPDVLALLEMLDERRGRPARKKDLVDRLRERGFLGAGRKRSAQAEQNVADRVLKRALEWGFVDSEGEGRRRRLRLNPRGEAGRKMFTHLPARRPDE